jgi:hypothetical protein
MYLCWEQAFSMNDSRRTLKKLGDCPRVFLMVQIFERGRGYAAAHSCYIIRGQVDQGAIIGLWGGTRRYHRNCREWPPVLGYCSGASSGGA